MGGWDTLQWLFFWAENLGAEQDIHGCCVVSDCQVVPCFVSAGKRPERQEVLRAQQPHEL